MSTPFLGQIRIFAGNFAISGYAMCNGQLLPISQNTALFSLLGTTYGGDGIQTFALPNLQGRLPINQGQGPGLTPYNIGEIGGTENVTLTVQQLPVHTHPVSGSAGAGSTSNPQNGYWAADPSGDVAQFSSPPTNAAMAPQAIAMAGGSQPHSNLGPYLCITFLIALTGIFPSRN